MYTKLTVFQGNQTFAVHLFKHRSKDCTDAQIIAWFKDLHPQYKTLDVRIEGKRERLTIYRLKEEFKSYAMQSEPYTSLYQASNDIVKAIMLATEKYEGRYDMMRTFVQEHVNNTRTLQAMHETHADTTLTKYLEDKIIVYNYFLSALAHFEAKPIHRTKAVV